MKCDDCGKEYKSRQGLYYHKRKNLCKSLPKKKIKKDKTKCEFCNTKFTEKNNYYRHKKHFCEFTQIIRDKNNDIEESKQNLNNPQNITNVSGDSIVNNIDNSIDNSKNVSIHINNYGREDLSNITKEEIIKYVKTYYDMIVNLAERIYITEESNRNIFIKDPKSGYVYVYQNDKWGLQLKHPLNNDTFSNMLYYIERFIDNYKEELEKIPTRDHHINAYNKINNIYLKNNIPKERKKNDIKRIELLFLNNKDLLEKTYKNSKDK